MSATGTLESFVESSNLAGLPKGWSVAPLGDVVDILDSKRVPVNRDERAKRPGSVPYYGATGQAGWIDSYLFDEELVLLGEDGAPFLDGDKPKAYMIRGRSWVNNHAHVLRGGPCITNAFLLFQLNQVDYRSFVSGTTRLKLPQGPMRQIPLAIAPLPEQRRIAAEIETQFTRLDAAVAALERARANLRRYRAAVLAAAVSEEHQTSKETGRCESCWNSMTVGEMAVDVTYGTSAKTNDDSSGAPVLRMGNILNGRLAYSSLKYLPTEHAEFPHLLLSPGDLLFNRTNSAELVGKCAVFRGQPATYSFASYLIRVRLKDGYSPEFLAYFINSIHGRRWIKSVVNQQVGQANVNGSKLKALTLRVPTLEQQHRIVSDTQSRLSAIDKMDANICDDLKRAERLRQSILRQAFSGQLVPQNPDDEPAEVMLERIREERAVTSTNPRKPAWRIAEAQRVLL